MGGNTISLVVFSALCKALLEFRLACLGFAFADFFAFAMLATSAGVGALKDDEAAMLASPISLALALPFAYSPN